MGLLEWTWEAVRQHADGLDGVGLSQVHQLCLCCELEAPPLGGKPGQQVSALGQQASPLCGEGRSQLDSAPLDPSGSYAVAGGARGLPAGLRERCRLAFCSGGAALLGGSWLQADVARCLRPAAAATAAAAAVARGGPPLPIAQTQGGIAVCGGAGDYAHLGAGDDQGDVHGAVQGDSAGRGANGAQGLTAAIVEEWIDPRTGYSLDAWVGWGRQAGVEGGVGVEVDGPRHFCAGTRRALGATRLKRRHLRAAGHALAVVPYWRWELDPAFRASRGLGLHVNLSPTADPSPAGDEGQPNAQPASPSPPPPMIVAALAPAQARRRDSREAVAPIGPLGVDGGRPRGAQESRRRQLPVLDDYEYETEWKWGAAGGADNGRMRRLHSDADKVAFLTDLLVEATSRRRVQATSAPHLS